MSESFTLLGLLNCNLRHTNSSIPPRDVAYLQQGYKMPRLKKNVAPLLGRSIESLILAIELFNRPSEIARSHGVLMFLQHSFEMLLKAAILQKTGRIHPKDDGYTYSFKSCLQIANEQLGILTRDGKITLEILDEQRDQAVHFYADVSEDMLYVHAQSSVTLFAELLQSAFARNLATELPSRILPISTRPPNELQSLLWSELQEVDKLLQAGQRRGAQAAAKLRSVLAFTVGTREDGQRINEQEIEDAIQQRRNKGDWAIILPEVVQLDLTANGTGVPVFFKISKNSPVGLKIAKPGEEVVGTLVKQEVDLWDVFNLTLNDIKAKLGLNQFETQALIYDLGIKNNQDLYRELRRHSQTIKGYSKKALDLMRDELSKKDMKEVVTRYKRRNLYGASTLGINSQGLTSMNQPPTW